MSLDFKKLNVASLNYGDIVTSLKSFLRAEPSLSSLDFDNEASAINMLCNILATGAAYNGVYSQFGYNESFLTTANFLESIVGIASNSSVLLEVKKSASTVRSVSVGNTLSAYTPFSATAVDGSNILFFNLEEIPQNTETTLTLYSGIQVAQYTDWDFNSQSIVLPLTVDPDTIQMFTVNTIGEETKWSKIDKSSFTNDIGYYFTVLNTVNGYLVTSNLPEAYNIDTLQTVYIRAVISNGSIGNNASINPPSNVEFLTNSFPSGGYDEMTVDYAKSKVKFKSNSENRCVTIEDYENAILQSNIPGTDDITKITVQNTEIPSQIKIYVENLSAENESILMVYLGTKAVAGINLIYSI